MIELYLEHWGLIPFDEAWARQREIQRQLIDGKHPGCIVFCEHPPTVTAGSSTKESSFILSIEQLEERGIKFFKIERGGDLTLHAPGQIVCYPLLDLNKIRRDVHWYMRALENAIIATCGELGVQTQRVPGKTGVWIVNAVGDTQVLHAGGSIDGQNEAIPAKKIASIGVRLSRWCSMHGLSLNVLPQPLNAEIIIPCGLAGVTMTSIQEELQIAKKLSADTLKMEQIQNSLSRHLARELGIKYR